MEKSDAYRKQSGSSKKWDGGGPGGGRGPYGGGPPGPPRGGLDNVRGLRDVRGADHSKIPFPFEHTKISRLLLLLTEKFLLQVRFLLVVPAAAELTLKFYFNFKAVVVLVSVTKNMRCFLLKLCCDIFCIQLRVLA